MAGPLGNALLTLVATQTRRLGAPANITLNVLLVYYDTIERLVIRDCTFVGLGRDLIVQGDADFV